MLLVFVEKVIEDFLVEESNTFKVVSRSWFKTDDFIYKTVGFMRKVSNVLLSLNFLSHIGGIITYL